MTQFLKNAQIQTNQDGFLVCDPYLETSIKDIYAAGDITDYYDFRTGQRTNTQHWLNAQE